MQIEHKILSFDMKSTSSDGGKWEGHGNAFFCIDSAQEIVDIGAFTDTIPQFLSDGFIGGLNHNWDEPIGKPMNAKEDSIGLWVDVLTDVDSNEARKCRDLIKKKIIKKLSIGYKVKASEWLETAEDVANYWQERGYQPRPEDIAAAQYGARLLTKLHLYEVSPVTVPANTMSDIERVKRYDADTITTEREFERFLRDAGFSKSASALIAVSGFKALRRRDAEEMPTEQEPNTETPAEAAQEVKTEETVEVETVVIDTPAIVKSAVNQEEVRALYASLLNRQQTMLATR